MTTHSGYVGWADIKTAPGGSIYLWPGCRIPVVLRRRIGGGYTVVRYACVQGEMCGERVDTQLFQERLLTGAWIRSQKSDWIDLEIY